MQPRPEGRMVFAQALDHPGMLLWNDVDGFYDEKDCKNENEQGYTADADFHYAFSRLSSIE